MPSDSTRHKHFSLNVHEGMDIAEHYFPERWYERGFIPSVLCVIGALGFALLQMLFRLYFDWRLGLIGAFVIIVGGVLDVYSTIEVLRLRPQFSRRKLPFPVYEANPILPKYPTSRELLWGKPFLVTLVVLPVAFVFPMLGIQIGISNVCAMLNNRRKKVRLEYVLAIARGTLKLRVQDFLPDFPGDNYAHLQIQKGEGGGTNS